MNFAKYAFSLRLSNQGQFTVRVSVVSVTAHRTTKVSLRSSVLVGYIS